MSKRNYISIDDLSQYAPDLDVSDTDATEIAISLAEDAIDFYVGSQEKFINDENPLFGVSTGEGNVVNPDEEGARFLAFLDLSDVPASYSGSAGLYLRVKATADGIEFVSSDENAQDAIANLLQAGTGVTLSYDDAGNHLTIGTDLSFIQLGDAPSSYTGQAGKFIKVKSTEDGVEFTDTVDAGVTSVFGRSGDIVAVDNDYTWGQIDKGTSDIADITNRSHTSLTDIGTNTHAQIDTAVAASTSHIANTSNPHSVTAAQLGAMTLTGDQTVTSGIKTFDVLPESAVLATTANQLTNYQTVANLVGGITKVQAAVRFSTTANVDLAGGGLANGTTHDGITAATGDRVLVHFQSTPSQNGIYVVPASGAASRATDFNETAEADQGALVTVLVGTLYSNTLWVQVTDNPTIGSDSLVFNQLPAPATTTASNGVQKVVNDFQIDLADTNPALEVSGGGLRSKVDDSTIERVAAGLQVKDLGITNAKLAGSIADSKLSTISTTNKVDWAAVNKTGSVLSDIADATTLTSATDGQVPVWNDTLNRWEPGDQTGGGGSGSDVVITSETVHAAGATAFAVTNMAAALTALSANTRRKVDLTGATQFRVAVTQSVAGFAGAKLRLQYSTNNSTFNQIDAGTSGDLDVGTGTGVKVGAWTDVVAGAKQDVWLQLYSVGGDGVVDPAFTEIYIQFKKNSTIVDGSLSSVIYEDVTVHSHPNSSLAWTAQPAAVTELIAAQWNRQKENISWASHYRIVTSQATAGFAGADLNLQYSLDGTNFFAADTAGAGEVDCGTGTGIKFGAWADLVDAAKGDVWLRLVGKDGNAVASPAWRQIKIQFKGQIFAPSAGSDTQVIFNDGGNAAGNAGLVFDKTTGKLTTTLLKITSGVPGSGKVLTSDADGDATWETPAAGYTDEQVDDRVAALLQEGAGIDLTYVDGSNTLTIASTITQYTDEMVDDRVNALLVMGAGLSKSYDDTANTYTITNTINTLAELTGDVDLTTTPPADGDILVYSNTTHYEASHSPLAWGGNDYKSGNLGVSSMDCLIFLFSQNPSGVTADGDTVDNEGSTSNLHAALVDISGGGGKSTMIITDAVASTSSGFESILVSQVDPSATVDNFKSGYYTYSGGIYTNTGLSGFEQAGSVTIVATGTTPAVVTQIPGEQKWIPGNNYAPQHFGSGIYDSLPGGGGGDTAQSVSTASRTLLNLDTDNAYANSEWNVDGGSHTFSHQSGSGDVVGYAVVTVTDDTGAPIPSALIEVEWKPGGSFVGLASGSVGSVAFPVVMPGDNTVEFRAYLTHTEIGSVDVFARVDIYWPR